MTCASLSHALSASDDFVFCCARCSIAIASAQSSPADLHCCRPLAISVIAALRFPARRSSRTASSHSCGAPVRLSRATSSSERAFETAPCASSSRAAASQTGSQSGHTLTARASVSRAAACCPARDSSCALRRCSFQKRGCALSAGPSSARALSSSPKSRSSVTDFIHTRSVPARSRARASSLRARSGWLFSDSSFCAASQTCSESGFARKASLRMARAPSTSPDCHFSFAPMSHSTCACGQYDTARRSSASSDSRVPCAFSCCAARTQTDFFVGKVVRATA
mmetsp:Transcript_5948/g.19144  ORF Transcript_5948/g.19144 Transcript_5948/m.19144 type:complete len:282 (+) Transcript_5948:700-1545(+)